MAILKFTKYFLRQDFISGDRAKELAPHWEKHNDDFVSLFYDGHNCFNSLLANDKVACSKILDNMRDFIDDNRKGWNKEVVTKVGVALGEGIIAYFDQDYNKSVDQLSKIMNDLQNWIQGSQAQKDIFRQILLDACIKSGSKSNQALAREILDKRLVELKLKNHSPVNQQFLERIISMA